MSFSNQTKFWNERFNKEEFIFGKEPNEYLVKQAKQYLKPGNTVLCIADGEGRNGVWLAKQGMQVDAFDVSDIALNHLFPIDIVSIAYKLNTDDLAVFGA